MSLRRHSISQPHMEGSSTIVRKKKKILPHSVSCALHSIWLQGFFFLIFKIDKLFSHKATTKGGWADQMNNILNILLHGFSTTSSMLNIDNHYLTMKNQKCRGGSNF